MEATSLDIYLLIEDILARAIASADIAGVSFRKDSRNIITGSVGKYF